jgi:macrolide transport system ATP-binding/permease protein
MAALLIMAAAGMVLVVACANVGSLQLARSRSRANEMRTRMSLGASRVRLVQQLMTESALTGALAGGAALLVTWAILKGAVAMMANAVPGEYGGLVFDISPDIEIFGFVSVISLVAGMLSGFAPAAESTAQQCLSVVPSCGAPAAA